MKVFLYSRTYLPRLGGLEQASYLLARELAKRGHVVTVATDVSADPETDRAVGFDVVRGRSLRDLIGEARRHDLVHSNGFSLLGAAIAERADRPLVFTHQGFQASCLEGLGWHAGAPCHCRLSRCAWLTARDMGVVRCLRQLARHPVGRIAARLADANVAVSASVAKAIRAPRTTIVHNCADTDVFRPGEATGNRDRFLFVGRFVSEKGVRVVLDALALERAAGRRWFLDLAGQGPLEGAYLEQARELGIEDSVRVLGPLRGERLAAVIRESLAVVVPSAWDEAFGIVAAEALACGRTALVSDRGGLPEIVDGLGTTVEATDTGAWARALRRAATDHAWREAVEARALEAARPFTPERYVVGYLETYARATASNRR